ncbi:hypothetical protein CH337_17600 [Rhodoblastus acidophilus]|nr:hypothetical protein CKO16_00080 [Rhodoblastus acidophilus]RAI17158.1 hypothetical protein CH337_17600 [Rhodoblastus acidophilus]
MTRMSENPTNPQHPFAPRPADFPAQRPESDLERFLGGSPGAVLARLVVLSLIVGFFLVWLDIRPGEVLAGLQRIVERFWAAGFDAVREIAAYLAAGAAIVVPVWLVLRLLSLKPRGQKN